MCTVAFPNSVKKIKGFQGGILTHDLWNVKQMSYQPLSDPDGERQFESFIWAASTQRLNRCKSKTKSFSLSPMQI